MAGLTCDFLRVFAFESRKWQRFQREKRVEATLGKTMKEDIDELVIVLMHVSSNMPACGSGLMTSKGQSTSLSMRNVFTVHNE